MGMNYDIHFGNSKVHVGKSSSGWKFMWNIVSILRNLLLYKAELECCKEVDAFEQEIQDLMALCGYAHAQWAQLAPSPPPSELIQRNPWFLKRKEPFQNQVEVIVPWLTEGMISKWVEQLTLLSTTKKTETTKESDSDHSVNSDNSDNKDYANGLMNEMGESIDLKYFLENVIRDRKDGYNWTGVTHAIYNHNRATILGKELPLPHWRGLCIEFMVGSFRCSPSEFFS
jgi:hypothetical protein